MTTLRDLLNRVRWRDAGLHTLEIHVLHRGAPGDRRVIAGSRIVAVRSGGIELTPEPEAEDDGVFLPYHRFLAVVGPDGEAIWSKAAEPPEHPGAPRPHAPSQTAEVDADAQAPGAVASGIDVVLAPAVGDATMVLDGSAGEGGGQVLRTALALAVVTRRPFVLENVRAGRAKPGLMRQHLASVAAAAAVSGAEVEGATLGSTRIAFRPGPSMVSGEHAFDVGSAGSASLVLQTVAFPLALAGGESRVTVRGGTHVAWAPPFPFLDEAWLPLVRRVGARMSLELRAHGFHPAGGGEVVMTVSPPARIAPLHLGDATAVAPPSLHAIVAGLPEEIARRELATAREMLGDARLTVASDTVRSAGKGNAMWLVARDEATGIVNVFSAVGGIGAPAEEVARDVGHAFLAWRASGTSVEPHLADQLMLPIALAGGGSFTTNELTLHARTNMEVIRAFTGARLRAWDLGGSRFRVELRTAS